MSSPRQIEAVGRVCRKEEVPSDLVYWRTRSPEERLDALEAIRKEFNDAKYGPDQRLQRVYRITQMKTDPPEKRQPENGLANGHTIDDCSLTTDTL
jgi:hypothetical protein